MAIYFLNMNSVGRTNGSSAVSAAAYRSGERLRDERTGRTYDHTERQDVLHKEIFLPTEFTTDDMSWAKDRGSLWNAAERAESRANSRVAREYLLALPSELSPQQRIILVTAFSRELVERYRFAVDVAIHAPRDYPGSDPRNFHAHLLATTREVALEGLGAKTTLEWSDARRRESGMEPAVSELFYTRARWASTANLALEEAKLPERIDHRTLAAQGIDREPGPRIPRAAYEMERHGYRSVVAERLRAEHQARVGARLQRAAQHTAAIAPQNAVESKNPEDIRRQAVEDWLRYREVHARKQSQTGAQTETQPVLPAAASRKNDYSL